MIQWKPAMPYTRRWYFLDSFIKKHGYTFGAELGVKRGTNIDFLLKNNPELHMVGVDIWRNNDNEYDHWNFDEIYDNFRDRMQPHGGRLTVHRMLTRDAAELYADGAFDFIFIDAAHDYNSVAEDIRIWEPKVREGGFVAGHDYDLPDVRRAVDEYFTQPHIVLGTDQCWGVLKVNDNIYRKRPTAQRN